MTTSDKSAMIVRVLADVTQLKKALAEGTQTISVTTAGMQKLAASLDGSKLEQRAHNIVAAINEVGGATKLTDAEAARHLKTLDAWIDKANRLGKEIPADILKTRDALQRVDETTAAVATKTSALGGIFQSAFGQFTMAGLATSAIQKLTSGVADLVGVGVKLPAVQQSFDTLVRTMGQDGTKMLSNMTTATKGMVSNYDLMLSANKAMLLGLPVTSESMGELAAAATTLGRAMGQDATKSVDDLITALGRSSPMILDNLGLSVKVGEANEAYAAKLHKTAEQLTDAEKKMAFYEAAMEAARKKTAELGEQTKTLGEIATTVWTQFGNIVAETAGTINVGLGAAVSSGKGFVMFLEDVVRVGPGAAVVMAKLREDLHKPMPTDFDIAFNKRVKEQQAEFAAAAAAAAEAHKKAAEAAKKHAEAIQQLADKYSGANVARQVQDLAEAMRKLGTNANYKALAEDIGKLYQEGAKLTPEMTRLGIVFGTITPKVIPISEALKGLETQARMTVPPMVAVWQAIDKLAPDPKVVGISNLSKEFAALVVVSPETMLKGVTTKAHDAGKALSDLSQAFSQMAQVANGSLGTVIRTMGTLVASLDTANQGLKSLKAGREAFNDGDKLAGILGMATGIMGIASAAIAAGKAIANIFDRNKGRDSVENFADTFGGFDALHAKLLTLGDAGEALWIKLTQGVGRNNPAQAQAVIDEVVAAFDKQKAAQDAATVSTEAGAQATIETATQAALALDELSAKLLANAGEWDAWSDAVTGYIQALANGIRALPPLPPSYSGGPTTITPSTSSGGGTGGSITARAPLPSAPAASRAGTGFAPTQINLNGTELWKGMIRVAQEEGIA